MEIPKKMSPNDLDLMGCKDPLVLLVDQETLELDYCNFKAKVLLNLQGQKLSCPSRNLKDFFHPDDLETIRNFSGKNTCRYRGCEEEKWKTLNVEVKRIADKVMLVEDLFGNKTGNGFGLLSSEYDDLLNSLDEGFCIVEVVYDKSGAPFDYLYLNNNLAFNNHVNFSSVGSKTVRELVKTPTVEWLQILGNVAVTGEPVRIQEKKPNLDDAWLDLFAFKVGGDKFRKLAILFHNLTGRKEQEEEIQMQFERRPRELPLTSQLLQNVFDNTDIAIAILKPVTGLKITACDFQLIRVNRVLESFYPEKEIHNSTLKSIVGKKDFQLLSVFLTKVIEEQKNLEEEAKLSIKDQERWMRIKARIQNEFLIISMEDITQRKKEAEELQESVQFKKHLMRTTPEIIMILDLNLRRISYINKDIFSETGLSSQRAQELSFDEIIAYVHPNDRSILIDFHYKILKSNPKEVLELDIRLRVNTKWEFYNIRGKVFKIKDQWVEQYMLVVRNINEQKNTQQKLLKAQQLSIQGDVAKTFAHELRNPLASIGMVSELIKKKLPEEDFAFLKPYFQILDRSKDQINNLISDLLNTSNYSPAVLEKESLPAIVDSSLEKAQDRIYLAGIKIARDFRSECYILADKEKLQIAILNLLVNASEAVIPGEGIITVSITNDDNLVILKISDNGAGIEKEHLSKLFDAFYTKKENGLGIGLNAVKNILEEHDADIEVFSKPGEGTCFTLKFMGMGEQVTQIPPA